VDDFPACLFEWHAEQALSDFFNLMPDDRLRALLAQWVICLEVLRLEPLHIDVRLKLDDIKHLSLQIPQAVFEIMVFLRDSLVGLFLRP